MTDLHVVPTAAARRAAAPSRSRPWLRGATLAAAATVGALVGFGLTDGASLSRLGVVALRLRGLPEFVSPDRSALGPALLGGAHAAVVGGAWGAALAAVAGVLRARRTRAPLAVAALAAAALAFAAADAVLPVALRIAAGALARGERVLVALLVAVAAWAGTRVDGRRAD